MMGYYIFPYDSNTGTLYPHPYYGLHDTMSNPPQGYVLLPAIADTDATAQAAYQACEQRQSIQYVVQNGALIQNPTWSDIELTQAKQARMQYLAQSFEQAISAGFPSSADTTSRTYAIDPVAMGKWTGTLALINSGGVTTNITVKDLAGNKVTLTPTQFKQFALDGFHYFNTQEQNLWAKEVDAESATTVEAVNAVTW